MQRFDRPIIIIIIYISSLHFSTLGICETVNFLVAAFEKVYKNTDFPSFTPLQVLKVTTLNDERTKVVANPKKRSLAWRFKALSRRSRSLQAKTEKLSGRKYEMETFFFFNFCARKHNRNFRLRKTGRQSFCCKKMNLKRLLAARQPVAVRRRRGVSEKPLRNFLSPSKVVVDKSEGVSLVRIVRFIVQFGAGGGNEK